MNLYEGNYPQTDMSNKLIVKTFSQMFLGLLVTAITAMYTYYTGLFYIIPFQALCIAELAAVLIFSFMFKRLSPLAVLMLFYVYAILNGLTFSAIFALFDISIIGYAFLETSAFFGVLALYGYSTKKDLSKFGPILTVALIVGLVMSVINFFMGSAMLDIALNWGILMVFAGFTLYDMNRLKMMQNAGFDDQKIHIYMAMQLYLDFINLFLRILKIFSGSSSRRG